LPVTSVQVTCIAAPVMGLVPISPLIVDLYTSVIPDLDKIAKLPATPRFTGLSNCVTRKLFALNVVAGLDDKSAGGIKSEDF